MLTVASPAASVHQLQTDIILANMLHIRAPLLGRSTPLQWRGRQLTTSSVPATYSHRTTKLTNSTFNSNAARSLTTSSLSAASCLRRTLVSQPPSSLHRSLPTSLTQQYSTIGRPFSHVKPCAQQTKARSSHQRRHYQQHRTASDDQHHQHASSSTTHTNSRRLLNVAAGLTAVGGTLYFINKQYYNAVNDLHHQHATLPNAIPSMIEIFGYQLPRSVVAILAINTAVFAAWQVPAYTKFLRMNFTCSLQSIVVYKKYHTLLTSAFSHATLAHFAFNTIGLATISTSLLLPHRELMGRSLITENEFLAFYLLSAPISQAIGWLVTAVCSRPGMRSLQLSIPSHGASGCVFALFACSAILLPHSTYYVMFIPYPISASTLLPCLAALDAGGVIYNMFRHSPLAHSVHLGGMLLGVLFASFYVKPKIIERLRQDQAKMQEAALSSGRRWF